MSNCINAKIDVTKIPKDWIFNGQKGKYIDIRIWENQDGEDRFGNTHVIKIAPPKEARERGEKPIIIGNGKVFVPANKLGQPPRQAAPPVSHDDDVPF